MKTVRGYSGYSVDRDGVVRGKRGPIKQLTNRFGVNHVALYRRRGGVRKGKCHEVHQLVADAFLPGSGPVYHVDRNTQNNSLSNLARGEAPELEPAPLFYLAPCAKPQKVWVPEGLEWLLDVELA